MIFSGLLAVQQSVLRGANVVNSARDKHGHMVAKGVQVVMSLLLVLVGTFVTLMNLFALLSGACLYLDLRDWWRERKWKRQCDDKIASARIAQAGELLAFSPEWTAEERLRLVVVLTELIRRDLDAGSFCAPGRPNIQSVHEMIACSAEELEAEREIIEAWQREAMG